MAKTKPERKVVLSKRNGWILLTLLAILDASLDVIFAGGTGLQSQVWKPVASLLKINNPIFFTPLILVVFYFIIKIGAWLAEKIDKIPTKTNELVLTNLVIAYGLFDLWLVSAYFFGLKLVKNHYYLIIPIIVVVTIYSFWAEKKLKSKE